MVNFNLNGESIYLRKLIEQDAKMIYINVKDKDLNRFSGPYYSTTLSKAKEYIIKTNKKFKNKIGFTFGIILKKNNSLIGCIGLNNINWDVRSAEVGFWLSKDFWNHGYMTEAVKIILNFGFNELKLHKIFAYFHEKNIPPKKIFEKCNFRNDGINRDSLYNYGKWNSEVLYSIISSEYNEKNK